MTTAEYIAMTERRPVDPVQTDRLRANVVDLVAILLADRGLEVERLDDGRRRAVGLEIHDGRAAVVLHVDPVIA